MSYSCQSDVPVCLCSALASKKALVSQVTLLNHGDLCASTSVEIRSEDLKQLSQSSCCVGAHQLDSWQVKCLNISHI